MCAYPAIDSKENYDNFRPF